MKLARTPARSPGRGRGDRTVAERRRGDQAALWFVDGEAGVGTGAVGRLWQFLLEGVEVVFQPVLEAAAAVRPRLPLAALR